MESVSIRVPMEVEYAPAWLTWMEVEYALAWLTWVAATCLRALGVECDQADVAGYSGYAFHPVFGTV